MTPNRKTVLRSALVFGLVAASVRAEGTNQSLFFIERSKNANIVQYDARLTVDGMLDPKEPVTVYWVLRTEGGRRQALSWLGRRGYGFDIDRDPSGKFWVMTLVAYPTRKITVRQTGTVVKCEIVIDGKPSILEKLYINSTEGRSWLKIAYIEIFGRDLETGQPTYEKLVPSP